MKTAISVPEGTFLRAEERAAQLGVNRSEFYSRAAEHYLASLDSRDVTRLINEALAAEKQADRDERDDLHESTSRDLEERLDDEGW